MNNNQYNDTLKNNERKGRGLFYGVVAVATFIIMAVGATFAYFAATASSANTSITTGSTSLNLELLSYETAWMKDDLIPTDTDVVEYAFANQNDTTASKKVCYDDSENVVDCSSESVARTEVPEDELNNTLCVDDYGNSVCSVYVFQVINDNASPQTMSFDIIGQRNDFSNLMAMAFEISAPDTSASDYTAYNTDSFGDPTNFTVMNGTTQVDTYTPVYVNRIGVVKNILNYTGSDAATDANGEAKDRALVHVGLEGEYDAPTDDNLSDRTTSVANGVSIGSGETRTYAIVLYIYNQNYAQSEDEDSIFNGSISVTTGDGQGVSGYISAVKKATS